MRLILEPEVPLGKIRYDNAERGVHCSPDSHLITPAWYGADMMTIPFESATGYPKNCGKP